MSAIFESHGPAPAGEYIVEVIGPDGLRHHVGPFKLRKEAEDWIALHPSQPDCPATLDKKVPSNKRSARRRPASDQLRKPR